MISFRQLIFLVFGILVILIIGVVGFCVLEGFSIFNSFWMTIMSLLTVGYGDLVPVTVGGKLLAMIIVPIGFGFFTYAIGTVIGSAIEGRISQRMGWIRMERSIAKLKEHIIVCGYGRVGRQVVAMLREKELPVVVIDSRGDVYGQLPKDTLFIEGDATEDAVLWRAGVQKATGIVLALPEDASNVLITLAAKGMNPGIQVVTRAERIESEEKLLRAGADKVINPSSIGGRRMAMSILKPASVEYVDSILHSKNQEFRVEEILIQAGSRLVKQSLGEAKIREKFGIDILAIKRGNKIISNPSLDETFFPDDLVIVFGSNEQLADFEAAARS